MPPGFVHQALSDLIGSSPAVETVEYPSRHTKEEIRQALEVVEPLLRPYPALRILEWFWETKAGKQVAQAQWMVYEAEAITPSAACRIIWGEDTAKRLGSLQGLIQKGSVHLYRRPNSTITAPTRRGKPPRPFYLRRDEVVAYVRREEILAAERERRWQTREAAMQKFFKAKKERETEMAR